MIVMEAKVMGILEKIINVRNEDEFTPIYLLCEFGDKKIDG